MRLRGIRGLVALTLVTAVALLALLVGGAAGGHGKGKPHNPSAKNGRAGFHFVVADQVAGTADRLIIQGDGNFNRNRASGGGTFDHFLAGTGPPATLVATGTWRATDVVSWTPGTSHGVYRGGILIMHATVKPNGQPQIKNVLIEVDCNLGPAGFSTGKEEGVVVTVPGPPQVVFTPTSPTTGVTIFTLGHGHSG